MGAARGKGPVQQKILKLLSDGKPRNVSEISHAIDIPRNRVSTTVQYLWLWGSSPENTLIEPLDPDEHPRRFTITKVGRSFINA